MAWTDRYINIPYVERGRSPEGCDCWGIVYLVLTREFGLNVPTYTEDYVPGDSTGIESLILHELRTWHEIPWGQERIGDLINIKIMGKRWHVGVVVDPKRHLFLHVMRGSFTSRECWRDTQWYHRAKGIYRHVGLLD